ncbi:hypothetical protein WJX74_004486 [Apatococcus lobatus]|uniref:glutathione transferase n=1 Tax=Apatococcus lobatus TaxID=904363 RepID=A0AAW1PR95_9CHLO
MASVPTIYYFDVKARAEPLKVALAGKGIAYKLENISLEAVKNLEEYPFGQAPRYKDESVDLVQTNAILRHIGRKYNMYGQGLEQQADIDVLLEGIQDFIPKIYQALVVNKDESSKADFWANHGDPSSKQSKTAGAHFAYLDAYIRRSQGSYAVGDSFTIADAALFSFLHNVIQPTFGDKLAASYPDLQAHSKRIAELPVLKSYLESG